MAAESRPADATIDQSNAASLRLDAAGIADVTSERLLEAVGGRDKYIGSVQSGTKAAKAQDITIVSHPMDAPPPPILADGELHGGTLSHAGHVPRTNVRGRQMASSNA